MEPFPAIVLATFLISLTAWIGATTLYLREELLDRILLGLVALAAGALIGGAFIHLIPRALREHAGDPTPLFLVLIGGFCLFYVLEQFISWHHHHVGSHEHEPVTYLVLASDTVHNFIDGLVIAAAFLIGPSIGVVTALAIALHEVPQEIGDYGVLVYGGFSRRRALVLNYVTQSAVIVGGVAGYALGGAIADAPVYLLPFAAGGFIYIASSDLVPEIKHSDDSRQNAIHFGVFLLGITAMYGVKLFRGMLPA
jgi:zinc and cadmium transporter